MSYEVIGWLIAIVVFIAAEAATVALVSVWFIGGAVCALIAAILGAPAPIPVRSASAASSGRPNVRPANASKKAAT